MSLRCLLSGAAGARAPARRGGVPAVATLATGRRTPAASRALRLLSLPMLVFGAAMAVAGAASPTTSCPGRPVPVPLTALPAILIDAATAWADSLCASLAATGVPSVQYHAAYRGAETPLASGACGLASRSPSVNATRSTLYRIASVSKLFPSLLLAQLADEGVVSADADNSAIRVWIWRRCWAFLFYGQRTCAI